MFKLSLFIPVSHSLSISLGYGQRLSQFIIKPCPGLLNKCAWQCLLTSTLMILICMPSMCHDKEKKQVTEREKTCPITFYFICVNCNNNQDFNWHRDLKLIVALEFNDDEVTFLINVFKRKYNTLYIQNVCQTHLTISLKDWMKEWE